MTVFDRSGSQKWMFGNMVLVMKMNQHGYTSEQVFTDLSFRNIARYSVQ